MTMPTRPETCGNCRVSLFTVRPDARFPARTRRPKGARRMTQTPHRPSTPLLDRVHLPTDLKPLSDRELHQLADELRAETISAVSVTGGHLGAGLGVVELTVALHAVFDSPRDKIIWDVGHQCYPHKILTGRRDRIRTLRTERSEEHTSELQSRENLV